MFKSVDNLFKPRTVAIIGASETGSNGWGKVLYENFAHTGFPARVYLVNPKRETLWGERVYPSVAALPEKIDLGIVLIPAAAIPDTLRDAAAHGMKSALICASQFGELGDEAGLARADALREISVSSGMRITGPNCTGALALPQKLLLYPHVRIRDISLGSLGVVFQSAGAFLEWVQQAGRRGLGVSYAVCSGNELDLDLADYINFMVEDPDTRTIACFVEGVRRPAAFMAVAEKALAAGKPILVLKIGRSAAGQAAAKSHTGALTGDDRVFDAVCAKFGVIRCRSLDDLIETSLAFNHGRIPTGERVGIALTSGGVRGLFLDHANDEGLKFGTLAPSTVAALKPLIDPGLYPDNPLDAGAGITPALQPEKYIEVSRLMASDPAIDMMVVQGTLPTQSGGRVTPALYTAISEKIGKPVIAFARTGYNVTEEGRAFQTAAGIPFLQGIPETARALKGLGEYGKVRRRSVRSLPSPSGSVEALTGAALERLLAQHDLPAPRAVFVPSADMVEATAFDTPFALKVVSPEASHKTEVGGVVLNLTNGADARRAATDMAARLHARHPTARVDGFLLQEMVSGLEIILGVREDPQYGPVMLVGIGGILVEALQDVAVRLLPVTEAVATEMLESLRGKVLLDEFRGRPRRDVAAIIRAMVGLSALYAAHRPWIADLEINPLIVLAESEGVRAVDVRLVPKGTATQSPP